MAKRRNFSAAFEAKVALEALRSELTEKLRVGSSDSTSGSRYRRPNGSIHGLSRPRPEIYGICTITCAPRAADSNTAESMKRPS